MGGRKILSTLEAVSVHQFAISEEYHLARIS